MIKKLTAEGIFECGFDDVIRGRLCALIAVLRGPGELYGLGIAVANEAGYVPVPLFWCSGDELRELEEHVADLNRELLDLDQKEVDDVIASTMSTRARRVTGGAT